MVRISLKGFTKEWDVFVKCTIGREKLPEWSRLWDDFTQEEIRERSHKKVDMDSIDENVALAAKIKKRKDLSKVRCYVCNKFGHFASHCPDRKKEPKDTAASAVENFVDKFEKESSLASFVSSVDSCSINGTWIVNSGSTSHMTGTYNAFQSIMEIEPGHFVDTSMNLPQAAVRGFGTVRFQLECGEFL